MALGRTPLRAGAVGAHAPVGEIRGLALDEKVRRWMRRYHELHGRRDPAKLGAGHVTAFLNALATRRHVSASTQNQALAVLPFLYRDVLGVELPWLDDLVHARSPERLPVVLARDEMRPVLARLDGLQELMATLLYGCGPRLLECCRLRVKDVDFGRRHPHGPGGPRPQGRRTTVISTPTS